TTNDGGELSPRVSQPCSRLRATLKTTAVCADANTKPRSMESRRAMKRGIRQYRYAKRSSDPRLVSSVSHVAIARRWVRSLTRGFGIVTRAAFARRDRLCYGRNCAER